MFATMGRHVGESLQRAKDRRQVVRAAGGIVLRETPAGAVEVAVVHRPDHDDWSLPKGKLDSGETHEACALREVLEETGYRCTLQEYVGSTRYRDRRGRAKEVCYWLMEVVDGGFSPSDEIDELRWLDLDVAGRALTYEHDRELLTALDTIDLARSG